MKNTFKKHINFLSSVVLYRQFQKITLLLCMLLMLSFFSMKTAHADTYHDDQHIQFWLQTLKQSPFILLQKNAARQLGLMGDARAKAELEYQGMNNQSHEVRGEALYALGRMGSMESINVLRQALNKESHPETQRQARRAMDILIKRRDYIRKLKDQ